MCMSLSNIHAKKPYKEWWHQKKLLAKDESKFLDSIQPSADGPEDEIDPPMLFGWNVNQLNKDVGGSPNGRAHVHRGSQE